MPQYGLSEKSAKSRSVRSCLSSRANRSFAFSRFGRDYRKVSEVKGCREDRRTTMPRPKVLLAVANPLAS